LCVRHGDRDAKLRAMKLLALMAALVTACIIPVQPAQQPAGGGDAGGGAGGGGGGGGGGYAGSDGSDGTSYSSGGGTAGTDGAAGQAPTAPSVVSVTIRSACRDTVKVFYGDKPKFGSGTYSSISSNSVQSHSFRPGDMFWIVDDSQAGLGSVTISAGTRELEITASCTGISAR
jgi:hypothetical protein